MDAVREKALQDYRKQLLEHAEVEGRLKESKLLFKICPFFVLFFTFALVSFSAKHDDSARAVEGTDETI